MASVGPPVANAASTLFPSDSLIAHILDYALPAPALTPVGLSLLEVLTANDNAIWVGSDDGDGALGTDVAGTHLPGIGTVVAWIGEDRIIHAKLIAFEADIDGPAALSLSENQRRDDSMLASLGSAGLANGHGSGRLALVATAKNTFTALWVADFGFTAALMGKTFAFSAPEKSQETDFQATAEPDVTAFQLPPVRITGSVEKFDVAVTASGETQVKVDLITAAGDIETLSFVLSGSNSESEFIAFKTASPSDTAQDHAIAVEIGQDSAATGEAELRTHSEPADSANVIDVSEAVVPANSTASPLLLDIVNLAPDLGGNGPGLAQSVFSVTELITNFARGPVALSNGGSAALDFEPGSNTGTARLTVEITPANKATTDQPRTVIVADNVILQDAGRPDLDVAPVVVSIGDDLAVSWLSAEEPQDGGAALKSLKVGIITLPSSDASDFEPILETVTLVTTSELISDIDLAGQEKADASWQWTLAWVQNADSDGYGALNLRQIRKDTKDDDTEASDATVLDHSDDPAAHNSDKNGTDDGVVSSADTVAGEGAVTSGSSIRWHSHWVSANSGGRLDERARAPDVSVVADGAIAVSWLSKGTQDSPGNTVHIVLVSNDLETVHRFDLDTQISGRIDDEYGPQIVTNGEGDFLVGWLREAGDGYEAVAATVHYAADLGWIMQPRPVVVAAFEKDPKDLQFRALEQAGETHIVVEWRDSGDTYQHILDFDGFDLLVPAHQTAKGSDHRVGPDSDDPIVTTVAVTIDNYSDAIFFSDTSEAVVVLLRETDVSLSTSEFGAAVATLSSLPAAANEGPHVTVENGWSEAQSIDDIIGAMGEQLVFSAEGLASGSSIELTAENDNSDAVETSDTIEAAFDALQFANVLNASANADVMTFDAAGFVQLKDFDPI